MTKKQIRAALTPPADPRFRGYAPIFDLYYRGDVRDPSWSPELTAQMNTFFEAQAREELRANIDRELYHEQARRKAVRNGVVNEVIQCYADWAEARGWERTAEPAVEHMRRTMLRR